MRYQIRRALALAIALALMASALEAQDLETATRAVVRIRSEAGGSARTGTGFVFTLDRDVAYLVTAAHVVAGDASPRVEFYGRVNIESRATVVAIEGDNPNGLAVLSVRRPPDSQLAVAALPIESSQALSINDAVALIGFPRGGAPWTVTRGTFAGRNGRELVIQGQVDEGSSGSPVIKDGRVFGILVATLGFGRAVTSSSLLEFISGVGVETKGLSANHPATGEWRARDVSYWGFLNNPWNEQFSFVIDGDDLSGTASFLGNVRRILNGKVRGNRISFDFPNRVGEGSPTTWIDYFIHYFGEVSGNEIRFQVQDRTKLHEYVARRVPSGSR